MPKKLEWNMLRSNQARNILVEDIKGYQMINNICGIREKNLKN